MKSFFSGFQYGFRSSCLNVDFLIVAIIFNSVSCFFIDSHFCVVVDGENAGVPQSSILRENLDPTL